MTKKSPKNDHFCGVKTNKCKECIHYDVCEHVYCDENLDGCKMFRENGVIIKGFEKPTECSGCLCDNSTGVLYKYCHIVDFTKIDETNMEIANEWYLAAQEHRRPKWCPIER